MIDKGIIRSNYSNMLDAQLLSIAKNDGHNLTPEAFQILKDEFQKRNLDYSFIELAEQNKIDIHEEKIQRIKESTEDDFAKAIWDYVLEEKENGTTNADIILGLQERGLDESHSLQLLSGVQDKLKKIIDEFDTRMLIGGASFVIGLLVTLVTYSSARSVGGYYIVAWGAILFGAIKFFTGSSHKGKYRRLMEKIQQDELKASNKADAMKW